jgi:hypothetical protein
MLTIVCVLLLIVIIYYLMYPSYDIKEHMSNDEAVANVASLYNTGNFKVSNMTTTDKLIINDRHKLVASPDGYTRLTQNDATTNIYANFAVNDQWVDNNLIVNKNATVGGDATITGSANVKGGLSVQAGISTAALSYNDVTLWGNGSNGLKISTPGNPDDLRDLSARTINANSITADSIKIGRTTIGDGYIQFGDNWKIRLGDDPAHHLRIENNLRPGSWAGWQTTEGRTNIAGCWANDCHY